MDGLSLKGKISVELIWHLGTVIHIAVSVLRAIPVTLWTTCVYSFDNSCHVLLSVRFPR